MAINSQIRLFLVEVAGSSTGKWKGSAFRPPKKAHQMGTLKWSVKVQQIGTPFFQIILDKKIRSSKSCIGS